MDDKFQHKKEYRIYKIAEASSGFEKIFGVINTHKVFLTHELAQQWIEDEGERHIEYTIVAVYKRD
jgi:hypothetical protein